MASLIFGIVLLSCLLMGAWYIIAGVKDFLFGGKRSVKDKERLASVMAQLRQEGFFNARGEWTVVKNRILSEAGIELGRVVGPEPFVPDRQFLSALGQVDHRRRRQ